MATHTWKLIDANSPPLTAGRTISLAEAKMPGFEKAVVQFQPLAAGLSEGVQTIVVDTGKISFTILPTRGMGIWQAKINGDQEVPTIGWKSPVRGPVHPKFVNVGEPSGLGWLDGFDELLVRCGLQSNGAPEFDPKTGKLLWPVHGLIANRPAHEVSLTINSETQEISVTGVVEETRFHFVKLRMTSTITAKLGESTIHVQDEIENFSGSSAEIQMLYHVNFGVPLLDAGSQLVAPVQTLVPRNAHAATGIGQWNSYAAPQPGTEEQVYFFELFAAASGQTRTLLKNAHSTRGASLVFDKKQLPCFTQWKNTTSVADGYVTGMEPGTNFPNPRSYEGEQGRVVKLAPGAKHAFQIALEIHTSPAEVQAAETAIEKIRAGRAPKVFDQPQEKWCAK